MDELIAQVAQAIAAFPTLPIGARLPRVGPPPSDTPIAGLIDHTLLKPEATPAQVELLCAEALQYRFASVCVNPSFVPLCARLLRATPVAVCTVIGFPLGATTTGSKLCEASEAIGHGARELDMVLHLGWLKAGAYDEVARDMHTVVEAAHTRGVLVKVIIETALLSDAEKVAACLLATRVGADFVKTSTGFAAGGATVADVALMRRVVGPEVCVKAAGGVRDLAAARALLAAGADRIGASASVAIVRAVEEEVPTPSGEGY